jgi:hypothetical protein
MAITRLTDLVTVFESKWTYGDVKFGYDGEVNQDHDTLYPLMLIHPPSSIMPRIYDGREEYEFEINFYNLYSQACEDVVLLQKRWDNLQDLINEWLDMVLKYYQDVTVQAYLNDESIELERVKEVANDKLIQIKLTFTMSAFTKCFRPVSNYPSDYSDLLIWLKADSGVTFDIPTKKVSYWSDQTTLSNDVSQETVVNQPLRSSCGGCNDKSYLEFNPTCTGAAGINCNCVGKYFVSRNLCPITTKFTIFEVSKRVEYDAANCMYDREMTVFGYYKNIDESFDQQLKVGSDSGGQVMAYVEDDEGNSMSVSGLDLSANECHISVVKLDGTTLSLDKYGASGIDSDSDTDINYNTASTFNLTDFYIGAFRPDTNSQYSFNGNLEEVVVYGRALSASEIADVVGYLNLKYNIY